MFDRCGQKLNSPTTFCVGVQYEISSEISEVRHADANGLCVSSQINMFMCTTVMDAVWKEGFLLAELLLSRTRQLENCLILALFLTLSLLSVALFLSFH